MKRVDDSVNNLLNKDLKNGLFQGSWDEIEMDNEKNIAHESFSDLLKSYQINNKKI